MVKCSVYCQGPVSVKPKQCAVPAATEYSQCLQYVQKQTVGNCEKAVQKLIFVLSEGECVWWRVTMLSRAADSADILVNVRLASWSLF